MKSILFVCHKMDIGGTEKALLSILKSLDEKSVKVTLLLLEKEGVLEFDIPDFVSIKYLQHYDKMKQIIQNSTHVTLFNFIKSFQLLASLHYLLTYFKIKISGDWYHNYRFALKNTPQFGMYDIAVAFAGPSDFISYFVVNKITAKKKVQWNHFDVNKLIPNPNFGGKFYPYFDQIFSVSENAKRSFDKMFPFSKDKSFVFHNIISNREIETKAETGEGFVDLFLGLRIVTLGRLSKEKGQQMIPNVVKRLKKEGLNFRWYLIGDGKLLVNLEQQISTLGIEEHLILLGSHINPYPFLKNCDLYVQTSLHEGYCITLKEAQVFNKPIVTTNFLSASNLVTHNEDGLIVDISEEGIFDGVKLLLENLDLRNKFSKSIHNDANHGKYFEQLLQLK